MIRAERGGRRGPEERAAGRGVLVITCEHAGNRIPPECAALFRGASRLLASHRGWDPGALGAARSLARAFRAPLLAVTWSRLLVEANRSPENPGIWSRLASGLSPRERERILDRYWRPHRDAVDDAVDDAAGRGRAVHVAVHSFTPVLDGRVRNADVGILYDPRRRGERAFAARWRDALGEIDPTLRVRRNYPYRGDSDGLTTWLRRRHPDRRYLGLELELNQALLAGAGRRRAIAAVAESLRRVVLATDP